MEEFRPGSLASIAKSLESRILSAGHQELEEQFAWGQQVLNKLMAVYLEVDEEDFDVNTWQRIKQTIEQVRQEKGFGDYDSMVTEAIQKIDRAVDNKN